MNCRRVEKLIPLYVERDLASGIAARLTSHLDWCGRCNWLADEYKESQSWLRTNEPPEFDAAYLDNFKAGVLRRVEESVAGPSLLASFLQHWSRRQVLALSAALLIIFGALVFYIYQVRMRVNPAVLRAVEETPIERTGPSTEPDVAAATERAPGAGLGKRRHHKSHTNIKAQGANSIAAEQRVQRPSLSQTNPIRESATASAEPTTALPGSSDDPPGMLRIEIETADPNIRIIWFAPKESESPQTK